MRICRFWMPLLITLLLLEHGNSQPYLRIINADILPEGVDPVIYENSKLNEYFDDKTFKEFMNCRNNNLQILDNQGEQNYLNIYFENIGLFFKEQIRIQTTPNDKPNPIITDVVGATFQISFNCQGPYYARNYWNLVKVYLPGSVNFSFLLNCDPDNRHKQFQVGYLILALLNAAIIIGVAMHSYAWSIKINLQPIRFQLQWIPFLIFSIAGDVIVIILLKFTTKDSYIGFNLIRIFGVVVAIPCMFLCLNEIFYLFKKMQKKVIKFVRWCDLISFFLTIALGTVGFLFQNWVYNNFMGICICISFIKILHFKSLKQAYKSMTILFASVSILGIVLHYILTQSYNDYAGELSSPLFLQVPDMIENLFKKCSWLPTIDIIVPGVMLSYLRVYDQNKSSRCGGVYTISGNITFIIATIIWIGLEYIYPFSIPFSLISYPILMLTIFVFAWRRSQWPVLWNGEFEQGMNLVGRQALQEGGRKSFRDHITTSSLEDLMVSEARQSQSPANSGIKQ